MFVMAAKQPMQPIVAMQNASDGTPLTQDGQMETAALICGCAS
jgi:hypothetical protein